MRRRVLTIAIFLLAGASVNVGVAWGCAVLTTGSEMSPLIIRVWEEGRWFPPTWTCWRRKGTGLEQIAFSGGPQVSYRASTVRVSDAESLLPYWIDVPKARDWSFDGTMLHIAAGWPLRCLEARCEEYDLRWGYSQGRRLTQTQYSRLGQAGLQLAPPRWHFGIIIKDQTVGGPFSATVLPLRPLGSSFATNSALWGLVSYALYRLLRTVVRWTRCRGGRCPICRFDLRGDHGGGCPECGWGRQQACRQVRTTP